MKLTIILMTVALLQVSASGHSQSVTFTGKEVSLKKVFSAIKSQTGNVFFYDVALLRDAKPVSVDLKNVPLEMALNEIFQDQPLTWVMENKTITIIKKQITTVSFGTDVVAAEPPSIDVRGKVVNENGEPVAGATVTVKGTKTATSTDANGNFVIKGLNENSVLVISATNIESREINVAGNTSLNNIVVKIKVSAIDEVQLTGYGSTTKRLNTGSIATVKGTEIKDRPVSNVLQALQGKVPGVTITTLSPGIGTPVQLLVRGANSITSGTNPLIIIDGVIINENPGGLISNPQGTSGAGTYQQGVSVMNNINPNDIESVDVLKDADATAIYGSRGTNGVILITTKKASLGKTTVSVNASTGWKSPTGVTKRMNTQQYLQYRKDAFATGNMRATAIINPVAPTAITAPDLVSWSQTAYTDFRRLELDNPAPNYNADITLSGGTKALNFLASAGYYKMYDTYLFNPYQERMTSRIQLNHTSDNNKFKFKFGSILGRENQKFSQNSFGSVLSTASNQAPNFELYKPDGSYNYDINNAYNPLPNGEISNTSITNNILLNSELSYEVIKDLVIKGQVSYNSQANEFHQIYPSTAVNPQNRFQPNPYGQHSTNKFTSVNIEPQINYKKKISGATISALAGATFLDKKINNTGVTVNNPGSDDLLYSYSSGQPSSIISNNTFEKFESVFGRVNMDWEKKYIANFSFRRDGSSRFGPNNRFANFSSAGLAWIFSSESFIKDKMPFLSYGKLRASLGTTGNYNIGNYLYLSLLTAPTSTAIGNYIGVPGLNPSNYANEDIQWERTTKSDIGIELGFFNNRILLNATWYKGLSDNLLVNLPLPSQTGFGGYTGNFPGKVQNTGLEFDMTTENLNPKSPVQWTTKLNISHNKNILKEFPNLLGSPYANRYEVGRALPSFNSLNHSREFPYHFTGIDPANGLPQYVDLNKDGVINSNDAGKNTAWFGSSTPTVFGGLNNSISYKGFALDIFLQFSNGIFTKWNFFGQTPGNLYNPSIDMLDNYWMKPGDVKDYPRLSPNVSGTRPYSDLISFYTSSTAQLYKGYYIRLKNVQLTYSLPANLLSKIKVGSASLYISGENLGVYTPVKLDKDPEVLWGRGNSLLRTITTGLRMNF